MTEREQVEEAGQFRPWEVRVCVALAVLLVGAAVVSVAAPDYAKPETWRAWWNGPVVETQVAPAQQSIASAPRLTKGPKVKYKGQLVSSWKATGAGDATYDGIYVEGGTYGGKPAYTNGSRWLWWYALESQWVLSTAAGSYDVTGYYSDVADLPANPWHALFGGSAPAPTLAVTTPISPPSGDWSHPYATYWWEGCDEYPGDMWLQPARCSLGSPAVNYVAFPFAGTTKGGFALFDADALDWNHDAPLASGQLFAKWDGNQGGAVFDAGDATNLYAFSGPYLDGATPKFQCLTCAVVAAISTTISATDTVTLPSINCCRPIQVAADTFRMMVESATAGTYLYIEYQVGDGNYTTLAVFSDVAAPPVGPGGSLYAPWELGTGSGLYDHVLFEHSSGAVYWMRHYYLGMSHRILVHEVTEDYCLQLDDVLDFGAAASLSYQTYGNYALGGVVVGDMGSLEHASHRRWVPGNDAYAWAERFTNGALGRHWYLDGSPLLIAGWGSSDLVDSPFVLIAAPSTGGVEFADFTPEGYAASAARIAYADFADFTPAGYNPTAAKLMVAAPDFADFTPEGYDALALKVADRTPSNSSANWKWVRARVIPA